MAKPRIKCSAVVGYVRVSTAEQGDSGLGLAAQRRTIGQECKHRRWELAHIYEDRASGKSLDHRPALGNALQILGDGKASVLVVAKLDRLSRSVADFANMACIAERQGWAILAADINVDMTTPAGGLLVNVTAAVAQWERQVISARTKEALAVKKALGVRLGRPRAIPAHISERIRTERTSGRTLQAIADALNAEGVFTPSGRLWNHTLVRQVSLQSG